MASSPCGSTSPTPPQAAAIPTGRPWCWRSGEPRGGGRGGEARGSGDGAGAGRGGGGLHPRGGGLMPRRHRAAREREASPIPPERPKGVAPEWASTEGFKVLAVSGEKGKTYRCPGCQQEI